MAEGNEPRVACVVDIGSHGKVILNKEEFAILCAHSDFFKIHAQNLDDLRENKPYKISLFDEMFSQQDFLAFAGKGKLSSNTSLANFANQCGYLMIKEIYAIFLLRSLGIAWVNTNAEVFPALYHILYRLSGFDNLANYIFSCLGFDYELPFVKNHESYSSFKKYVRSAVKRQARFLQMEYERPWTSERFTYFCSCEMCYSERNFTKTFGDIFDLKRKWLDTHGYLERIKYTGLHNQCPVCYKTCCEDGKCPFCSPEPLKSLSSHQWC